MKKLEAQFTTKLRSWIAENLPTCAIEVKHTRGKKVFYTRELKDHQLYSLKASQSRKGILYKIPDNTYGFVPFDMFQLKKEKAYVILVYPANFYVIPIEVMPLYATSMTESDADVWCEKKGRNKDL